MYLEQIQISSKMTEFNFDYIITLARLFTYREKERIFRIVSPREKEREKEKKHSIEGRKACKIIL